MTPATRLLVLFLVSTTLVFLARAQSSAQGGSNREVSPSARLQLKAKAAKDATPSSVRSFTDEVFQSTVGDIALSLRDRLFKAELAFKKGTQLSIQEDQYIETINQAVDLYRGPEFLKTNKGQLQRLRVATRKAVPDLVSVPGRDGMPEVVGSEMSPAEAVLMTLKLGLLKLAHPDYQIAPAASEERLSRSEAEFRNAAAGERGKAVLHGVVHYGEEASFRLGIRRSLRDESSEAVLIGHLFLDQLGILR